MFRLIKEDIVRQHPDDWAVARELELAEIHSGLSIEQLDSDLAVRITNVVRQTATDILTNKMQSSILNGREGNPQALGSEYRETRRM